MQGKNQVTMVSSPRYFTHVDGTQWQDPSTVYSSVSLFSGWALRRGDHKSPLPHAYSRLLSTGGGTLREVAQYYTWHQRVMAAYPSGVDTAFSDVLYNECIDKINGKVRGDLDLSVDAFQARQTARQFKAGDLITNFADDLTQWDRRRRSGDVSRAIARAIPIARLAGALRLTWVYGWKPLIQDFYGVLDEGLRSYINHYQTYNAVTSTTRIYTCAGLVENGSNNYAPFRVTRKESCRVSITLDTANLPGMANWTSLNPASIAWELLPFSFVVDWFIDVGSTLRSIETALLYNRAFKSGFVSRIVINNGKSTGTVVSAQYFTRTCTGQWAFSAVNFDRTVLASFPVRRLPSVDVGLSSPRLFNAIGLLTQFLGGKRK